MYAAGRGEASGSRLGYGPSWNLPAWEFDFGSQWVVRGGSATDLKLPKKSASPRHQGHLGSQARDAHRQPRVRAISVRQGRRLSQASLRCSAAAFRFPSPRWRVACGRFVREWRVPHPPEAQIGDSSIRISRDGPPPLRVATACQIPSRGRFCHHPAADKFDPAGTREPGSIGQESTVSFSNLAEPSQNRMLTPPGCMLDATPATG